MWTERRGVEGAAPYNRKSKQKSKFQLKERRI